MSTTARIQEEIVAALAEVRPRIPEHLGELRAYIVDRRSAEIHLGGKIVAAGFFPSETPTVIRCLPGLLSHAVDATEKKLAPRLAFPRKGAIL